MNNLHKKILLPGGAGLVGQNLVARLKERGYKNIVVIDKHRKNLEILKEVQPDIEIIFGDLSVPGDWQKCFIGADVVVMLQAQIGGLFYQEFIDNNITSTKLILKAIKESNIPQLIHVSSSVVESIADDFYTRSKIEQEKIVLQSGISCPILRPTLMFGWFDRKHLGGFLALCRKYLFSPFLGMESL